MTNCSLLSIVLALTALSAKAHAEPPIVSETRGGVEGAWVPDDALHAFLADHNELSAARRLTDAQGHEVTNLRVQVTELQQADAQRMAVNVALTASLAAAENAQRSAEAELNAWYRNPLVIGAGGLVVGVLLTALVITR